jgi:hypothetical protein
MSSDQHVSLIYRGRLTVDTLPSFELDIHRYVSRTKPECRVVRSVGLGEMEFGRCSLSYSASPPFA